MKNPLPTLLYEDNHILVIVKPPGIATQAGRHSAPDLLELLKRDLAVRHKKPGEAFLGLVHRLDQPASGLMVFAKTSKAASRLSESFRQNRVQRSYLAIGRGLAAEDSGVLEDTLSKNTLDGRVRLVEEGEGSLASLSWQVLARKQTLAETLFLIELHTGRRHQIRVQMAAHGFPLLGDRRYGLMDKRDSSVPTVALHACRLAFPHPVKDQQMEFENGPAINPAFEAEDTKIFEAYLESSGSDAAGFL